MLSSKELNALGIPNEQAVMSLAMRLVNIALSKGANEYTMRTSLKQLSKDPGAFLEDPVLSGLAMAMEGCTGGFIFVPRETSAPWRQWGNEDVEESAVRQMENACQLPNAVRGALMPDAHTGYGLPIGGVLAVDKAVIPYAVGVDIACRMRLTVLDWPISALQERQEVLEAALELQTRFGIGAAFHKDERREHGVMDEDWGIVKGTGTDKNKAWKQLGTSGGGNHFVEYGELHLARPADIGGKRLEQGVYLALLSHSGSRGPGESVAVHYSKLAMSLCPGLPQELRHLAWLDLDSEPGQSYWTAMQLMGRYASANHELIHKHILDHLGASAMTHVENHHNFAWKEIHDGQEVIVHRKGATPAAFGIQGIVPGSMGTSGFVVQGKGNDAALASCSHGAGRLMSRTMAFNTLQRQEMLDILNERGVKLLSGGLDESPAAYKNIYDVIAMQSDLVEILARFEPRLVKMAPEEKQRRFRKKNKN